MRRVRVRCLAPGLAFSAFLVVMLQWYTLQVLHSVRSDEHAFTSFVGGSVEAPARVLPTVHSLLDELEEEGATDAVLSGAPVRSVDPKVDDRQGSDTQEAPVRREKGEGHVVGSKEQAGREAAAQGADTDKEGQRARPSTVDSEALAKRKEKGERKDEEKGEDDKGGQALLTHTDVEQKVIVDKKRGNGLAEANRRGADTQEAEKDKKEARKPEKESAVEEGLAKERERKVATEFGAPKKRNSETADLLDQDMAVSRMEAQVKQFAQVSAQKAAEVTQATVHKAAGKKVDPEDEEEEEEEVVTIRRRKRHKAVEDEDMDAQKPAERSRASKALTSLGREDKRSDKTRSKARAEEGSAGLARKYKTIGIYSIFIGVYKTFLPNFLVNMRGRFVPSYDKVFFIVTDDAKLCARLNREEDDVQCVVKERIGWPYETLYRWAYFRDFDASETDYVWFFNANSQVVDTVSEEEVLAPYTAVLHDLYIGRPYDVVTFEKRPLSFAFVPNRPHYRYFGARMLGATTDNFLRMCKTLDRHTRLDEANQIIADWHDESHYNHYVNVVLDGKVKVLGTEYHVPEEYGPEYMPTGRKVIYLDKKAHIPDLAATKSQNWQDWVGGKVKVHKYFDLPDFHPDIYRELNYEAKDMTETQMIKDYRDNFENRLYFHETPVFAESFDVHRYRSYYNFQQSENWCKLHYNRWGYKESRFYFLKKGAEKQDIAISTVIYYDEHDPAKVAVKRR